MHVHNFSKTRAAIEDAVVKSMVARIKQPVNDGAGVRARVAGRELEAAAKTVTVPTSPTKVQAMFVGFDDDQPEVHEVDSSTESEVHITSMKCSCERCKMSSLSAAPSRLPGMAGHANDAVSAHTQVRVSEAPRLLRFLEKSYPQVWIPLPRKTQQLVYTAASPLSL